MDNREIVVSNLSKRYGEFHAVREVSFRVRSGEVFGFLGPNGAGKSTTVSMLTTLVLPSDGTATVGGFDIRSQPGEVRQIAGVALQEIGLDPFMKAPELLLLQAQLFGLRRSHAHDRVAELLSLVKLNDPQTLKRPVGKYSGGMRRRLDLALALIHRPQVLFLDEPTTGLDPASRRDIWAEVRRLNQELGMTIFLTTQYLEEADALADRIAIINKGQIAVEGTPAQLKGQLGAESINITFQSTEDAQQALGVLADLSVTPPQHTDSMLRLYVQQAAAMLPTVVARLQDAGIAVDALTLTQPTLDDVFLEVTGQRLTVREEGAKEETTLHSTVA
ncbi:MAG: ATP-binding cassette domain-containing protein [bacterium]|nr:ATP-binding cassette domain-containing protein [bacterium]